MNPTKQHSKIFRAATAAVACVLLLAAGCGDTLPSRVPVSGVVTIDGQPVPDAFITFYPAQGRSSRGTSDSDGRFTLSCFEAGDGALLGEHAVTVTAVDQTNPNKQIWLVPEKYGVANQSGLTVQVDGQTDQVQLKLTWDGERRRSSAVQGE